MLRHETCCVIRSLVCSKRMAHLEFALAHVSVTEAGLCHFAAETRFGSHGGIKLFHYIRRQLVDDSFKGPVVRNPGRGIVSCPHLPIAARFSSTCFTLEAPVITVLPEQRHLDCKHVLQLYKPYLTFGLAIHQAKASCPIEHPNFSAIGLISSAFSALFRNPSKSGLRLNSSNDSLEPSGRFPPLYLPVN